MDPTKEMTVWNLMKYKLEEVLEDAYWGLESETVIGKKDNFDLVFLAFVIKSLNSKKFLSFISWS